MRLRHLLPLVGGLSLLAAYGCAGGSQHPSIPTQPEAAPTGMAPPLGSYTLTVTAEGATLLPNLAAQGLGDAAAYDATGYFTSAPCADCARIDAVSRTLEGKLAVDIALRHPYRSIESRFDLDVFDVRGILGVNDAFTFPTATGILEAPLTTNPNILLNADGYTTHFNEALTKGDATLNPYRRFFTEDDPTAQGEGAFLLWSKMPMASEWDIRRYVIEPAQGPLVFDFVIEASYGQSARGPQTTPVDDEAGRLNPTYYNPEFNQKEAFSTGFAVAQSPPSNEGGNVVLVATILDWQQDFLVEEIYPNPTNRYGLKASSNIGDVRIEIPGLGIAESIPTNTTGTGSIDDPMQATWSVPIGSYPEGLYPALLVVEDELYDPETMTESRQDMRAFQVVQVRLQEGGVSGAIPQAILSAVPAPATAILRDAEFIFYGSNSFDPDLVPLNRFEFDWNYDGVAFDVDYAGTTADEAAPTHRYGFAGDYVLGLRVGNTDGELSDIVTLPVHVMPDPIIPSPSVTWANGLNLSGSQELVSIDGPSDSSICVSPTGTTHVVWVTEQDGVFLGTDVFINHVSITPSGVVSATKQVYNELVLEATEPRSAVAVLDNNSVVVVWSLTDGIQLSQRNGSSWTEPITIAGADNMAGETLGRFDLVARGNTNALAYEVYFPNNSYPAKVYVMQGTNGQFGVENPLGNGFGVSSSTPGSLSPTLTPINGGLLLAWSGGLAADNLQEDVFLRRSTGSTWSAVENIASDPTFAEIEPAVTAGPDGSIAVAWRTGSGIYARVARTGETFGNTLPLFASTNGRVYTGPTLVAGPNGALACAVLERETESDPGTVVTLAFHKDHSDPSYFGNRTRGLQVNTGNVFLNPDMAGGGQDAISSVVEFRQTGWSYIRLIRGTFVQP